MKHDDRERERAEAERITQDIRSRRGFTVAGALAGRDGGGHLEGASPTPLISRARLNLAHWLRANLDDGEGALRDVILRALTGRYDLLARHADEPAAVLSAWLPGVLAMPALLADLVRQADMQWGRANQERPFFERDGEPPHPDDPYTRSDVERRLRELLARAEAR